MPSHPEWNRRPAAAELAAYLTDQLSPLSGIRSIPMMGGYVFYYKEKIFGGIYPDGVFIKDVPAARAAMPDSVPAPPYKGAKPMLPCTLLDNTTALCAMVEAIWPELPQRKPRKK